MGGGRPKRRARKAEDAAATAAAAARRPRASLTPDPRMEPALGAAAAPGAPPTRYPLGPAGPGAGGSGHSSPQPGGARARWETPLRSGDSRYRRCAARGGRQHVKRRTALSGLVAGERRDHPARPAPIWGGQQT